MHLLTFSGHRIDASLCVQDRDERTALIKAARVGLDHAGLEHVAIVAGAGAASTRESIELAQHAAAYVLCVVVCQHAKLTTLRRAGADAVLVVVSGYYTQLLQKNMEAVEKHFIDIAGASPIPVCVLLGLCQITIKLT